MFFFPGFPAGLYSAPMDLPGGSIKDAVDVSSAGEQAIYDIYDKLAEKFPKDRGRFCVFVPLPFIKTENRPLSFSKIIRRPEKHFLSQTILLQILPLMW